MDQREATGHAGAREGPTTDGVATVGATVEKMAEASREGI